MDAKNRKIIAAFALLALSLPVLIYADDQHWRSIMMSSRPPGVTSPASTWHVDMDHVRGAASVVYSGTESYSRWSRQFGGWRRDVYHDDNCMRWSSSGERSRDHDCVSQSD